MSIPVGWFIQILNMSLGAAWAALLVMAGRLLLQKAPKKIPYALWGVVLFRLVCPVSFTSIFSLMTRPLYLLLLEEQKSVVVKLVGDFGLLCNLNIKVYFQGFKKKTFCQL